MSDTSRTQVADGTAFVGYPSSAGARQGAETGGLMIYFDNAATSCPKPPNVAEAMTQFIRELGANPGRAAHRQAVESGRIVSGAREAVCKLFHAPDPLRRR